MPVFLYSMLQSLWEAILALLASDNKKAQNLFRVFWTVAIFVLWNGQQEIKQTIVQDSDNRRLRDTLLFMNVSNIMARQSELENIQNADIKALVDFKQDVYQFHYNWLANKKSPP